jgi:hypothetical protein
VGSSAGGQSNFSQRAHWLWSTRDLPCFGERDAEGGFELKASGETEEPPETFTRHQHTVVTPPLREAA